MTPEVQAAVEEIRRSFPDHRVNIEEEAQGGAYVMVHDLSVGGSYDPPTSWVGFLIPFQYPEADVYPLFLDGQLRRSDDAEFVAPFSRTNWRGRAAIQVSRRSNHLNPATDTAATKLMKVLEYTRSR